MNVLFRPDQRSGEAIRGDLVDLLESFDLPKAATDWDLHVAQWDKDGLAMPDLANRKIRLYHGRRELFWDGKQVTDIELLMCIGVPQDQVKQEQRDGKSLEHVRIYWSKSLGWLRVDGARQHKPISGDPAAIAGKDWVGHRNEAEPEEKPDTSVPPGTKIATIVYTNHRGETAERRIQPHNIWFGSTEWHPQPAWFLRAYCMERLQQRDFAMADIKEWRGEWRGAKP